MDLMERYLAAIGRELPEAQRADITAELRDALMSRVEEREEALGRPLDRRELEKLLVDYGHPLVVAHRYRRIQHLVGPDVFPFWWAGLKATLVIGAGVYVVLALIALLTAGDLNRIIARAIPDLWKAFLIAFAVVTLIAVGLEQGGGVRRLARWRPSQLPPPRLRTRSRFDHVVEIGFGVIFILWWVGAIRFRDLAPDALAGAVTMAPTWDLWRGPVLAYLVFELFANLLSFVRPAWARTNATLRLMRNLAGAGLLAGILQTGPWVEVADATLHSLTEAALNRGVEIGLTASAVLMLALAVHSAWRLVQSLGGAQGRDGGALNAAS